MYDVYIYVSIYLYIKIYIYTYYVNLKEVFLDFDLIYQ